MRSSQVALLTYLLLGAGCTTSESARGSVQPTRAGNEVALASAGRTDTATKQLSRIERPDVVRGLYVNRWAALGTRMWQLIELA